MFSCVVCARLTLIIYLIFFVIPIQSYECALYTRFLSFLEWGWDLIYLNVCIFIWIWIHADEGMRNAYPQDTHYECITLSFYLFLPPSLLLSIHLSRFFFYFSAYCECMCVLHLMYRYLFQFCYFWGKFYLNGLILFVVFIRFFTCFLPSFQFFVNNCTVLNKSFFFS